MKIILSSLLMCFTTAIFGQTIEIYSMEMQNKIDFYVKNLEHCPVTIEMDLAAKNMRSSKEKQTVFVIPPMAQKYHLLTLETIDKQRAYEYSYNYFSNYGDHLNAKHDDDYIYWLPFESFASFPLHQGYNGTFSHYNINALDFAMPEGSPIHAARSGTVVKVVEKHSRQCDERSCAKYNNLIMILHSDGTFSEYVHLKKNGAIVNVGDQITKGQQLGWSGKTGWSNGPHLHFAVYKQLMNERETFQTKFKIQGGQIIDHLLEKQTYTRDY